MTAAFDSDEPRRWFRMQDVPDQAVVSDQYGDTWTGREVREYGTALIDALDSDASPFDEALN